jgi:hypothetical protein
MQYRNGEKTLQVIYNITSYRAKFLNPNSVTVIDGKDNFKRDESKIILHKTPVIRSLMNTKYPMLKGDMSHRTRHRMGIFKIYNIVYP